MKKLNWLIVFLLPALIGMSCNPGSNNTPPEFDGTFTTDTILPADNYTFEQLSIDEGVTVSFENDVEINVTGDTTISGSISSSNGKLTITTDGSFSLSGNIDVQGTSTSSPPADPENASFSDQIGGVYLIAKSSVNIDAQATVTAGGPIVLSDDPATLSTSPRTAYDDTNSTSGDLPTLVPLPEGTPIQEQVRQVSITPTQAIPINIRGNMVIATGAYDRSGLPGDTPIVLARFSGNRDLSVQNFSLVSPPGVDGTSEDKTDEADVGEDANGGNGKPGLNFNIENNGGSITLNDVVIDLADGGNGGDADTVCANATGGDGASSGNFRASALAGIDLSGPVTLNPGAAGSGGFAFADATDGTGCSTQATGGDGADNSKQLFARGRVDGLDNLTIGDLIAGDGGDATATGGDGKDGDPCEVGQNGGDAEATAGDGGDASLNLNNLPVTSSAIEAGTGGTADAIAGVGGDGGDTGDCGVVAGAGGDGGEAEATGGQGGDAEVSGGAANGTSGNGGDADVNGGNGGSGGNACPPNPLGTGGKGGNGGDATATAGTSNGDGAAGATNGRAGDGNDGGAGQTPGGAGSKGTGSNVPDGADGNPGQVCGLQKLNVEKDGSGTGTVTGSANDPVIDCGGTCSADVAPGATVNLSATPDEGSVFVSWSGTNNLCTGNNPACSFTMPSEDVTIVATFGVETNFSLTVVKDGAGDGTVTGSGIDCGGSCEITKAAGESIDLQATPDEGSFFVGWTATDGLCTGDGPCSFTMPAGNVLVTAVFEPIVVEEFNLTIAKDGTGSGTVAGSGIGCGAVCTVALPAGSAISLVATADTGSIFVGWTASAGECTGAADCSFNMPANDVMVTATFNTAQDTRRSIFLDASSAPPGFLSSGDCLALDARDAETNEITSGVISFTYLVPGVGFNTESVVREDEIGMIDTNYFSFHDCNDIPNAAFDEVILDFFGRFGNAQPGDVKVTALKGGRNGQEVLSFSGGSINDNGELVIDLDFEAILGDDLEDIDTICLEISPQAGIVTVDAFTGIEYVIKHDDDDDN